MSATHIKFVGWQICFDTHFYVRQRCVGSCQRVERVSGADRVGYSPCSKPLVVEGYLSQQMPERGRCFSSSMRQIPRARVIHYLFISLFIPVQLGVSQLHTNTLGQHLPLCALVLWCSAHETWYQHESSAQWTKIRARGVCHIIDKCYLHFHMILLRSGQTTEADRSCVMWRTGHTMDKLSVYWSN